MQTGDGSLVDRHLTPVVLRRMTDEPVIVLTGPRTVGKSTLLRAISAQHGRPVFDLDDSTARRALERDPSLFAQAEGPVLVDEFQRVPDFLDAIKAELNQSLRPGRFVLTGSTRYSALPRTAQSLTGRVHVMNVWPLSQGELRGQRERFLDRLLEDPRSLVSAPPATTTPTEYMRAVLAGGLPLARARSDDRARGRWFSDYVRLVVDRDVPDVRDVRRRDALPRLLRRLAGQTGSVLNLAAAARDADIDAGLAADYTTVLEAVFLVHRLPAWGRTLLARAVRHPKLHVVDSGLAAHLLGVTIQRLEAREPAALSEYGHLLESFAVAEVLKQVGWSDELVSPGHFRTHDGMEVDLVLERPDEHVVGIEVKASARVAERDLSGLRSLRTKLGAGFSGGVVLYTGQRSYTVEDRLHVVPLEQLWA